MGCSWRSSPLLPLLHIAALACEWLVSRISARAGDISHFVSIRAFLFPSAVCLVAVLLPA